MPTYLDCAATTPTDPRVAQRVVQFLTADYGNAGSRTHEFGVVARAARNLATPRTLRVVGQIQPAGGGFLEATPLTGFVVHEPRRRRPPRPPGRPTRRRVPRPLRAPRRELAD